MRIRFRSLAALVALIALSLFWVEGVWASMCPSGMEAGGAVAAAAATGSGAHACPVDTAMPPSDSDRDRSESSHCPLTAVGTSCAVGLPLPAESTAPAAPSSEGARLVGSPDHAKDLLLAVSLLRPPQA